MPSAPPPRQGFQGVLQVPDARDTEQQVRLSEVDVTKITRSYGWVGCRVYKAKSYVKATAPPQESGLPPPICNPALAPGNNFPRSGPLGCKPPPHPTPAQLFLT